MKKQFWIGLFTGLIISAFIGCIALCVNILFLNNEKTATQSTVRDAVDKRKGGEEATEAEANKDSEQAKKDENKTPIAADGYVLNDERVVNKMMDIEELIDKNYVEPVDNETLEEGIYEGMILALDDPYAAYYTAEEYKSFLDSTEGIYYGIGAYLQKDVETKYPKITGIIANSPAESSNLRVDDYITKVDGVDVFDMDLSEAVMLIKGEEGTEVTLTIVRVSTGEEFEEKIIRQRVESPSVTYKMYDNNIAYIQITEFDAVTVDQFREALNNAKADGMKGMVLDLRGNPGGSVGAVVEIGRMILPKGLVVYTEDKYGKRDEYSCDGASPLNVPLVVLVDGNSASSAEILSGAIKDHGIGTLMGTTTYGKGIVQRIIGLDDGSAVKMTVSHYYTPNGNDIHKVGIEPDIEVKFDADAYRENKENDNQLKEALDYVEKQIK